MGSLANGHQMIGIDIPAWQCSCLAPSARFQISSCVTRSLQVLPAAALGCASMTELLQKAHLHMPPAAGGLLHAAVRSQNPSMVVVLLDLAAHG